MRLVVIDAYGIAVLSFMGLVLTVGILTSFLVKKSSKRYMVAGKSLPLFFVGTMLSAQSIDGNSSLGNVALVYQFGFWAGAVIPIGLALCLILTGIVYGPKLNKMSMLTLPDFYYRRYGVGAEGISSVILMISFIILVAGNFAAGGFILSTVLHIDLFWAMLIVSFAVLVYTFAGGLFSSAYTDIFQVYLTVGAFWAAFLFFVFGFSGVDFGTILGSAPEGFLDLSGLISMEHGALAVWGGILALGLGDVVALDFMERVFSAKDGKTARRGALMAAGLTISIIVPVSLMGIVALHFLPNLEDPVHCISNVSNRVFTISYRSCSIDGSTGSFNVHCKWRIIGYIQCDSEKSYSKRSTEDYIKAARFRRQKIVDNYSIDYNSYNAIRIHFGIHDP